MKKKINIDWERLPRHIAIMMDGNGRWAKKRFLIRKAGHKAGAQALRVLSEKMNEAGFPMITVFAFSTENWKRSESEVYDLMNLLRDYIRQYIEDTSKNNMRINVIGDKTRLDADLQESIAYLEQLTKDHKGMCVNIAVNYGGRDDILRAAKKAAEDIISNRIKPKELDETLFSYYLDTGDFPDPELFIRTSGELRLSNFMLWQLAYSEFYFCDKLWPDFGFDDLLEAVEAFQNRERRFGGRQ